MVSRKVADALAAYSAGPFGYDAIDMNALFSTASTDWLEAGTEYTPAIISRNTEAWRKVETDSDYTYDASVMYIPLPRHHMYINLVEIEFEFEGLFGDPSSGVNTPIVTRIEVCKKVDGVWTPEITRIYNYSLIPIEGGRTNYRQTHFYKTFINWDTGYDAQQYIVRPVVTYAGQTFRIEKAYCRVYLHRNPITE